MKILNTELKDVDFNDADDLEKFENAIADTKKVLEDIKPDGKKASEVIRESCNAIFDCFNTIFGEGTAKKVFGERTSIKICIDAFNDLKAEKTKQDQELDNMVKNLNSEYSPNRATRRAKK